MENRTAPTGALGAGEEELVEGCRAGNSAALDRFFRAYAPRVERVLGRLLGPTADLEDALQDTFIASFGAFRRFRGEASLGTWVTRIAVHVAHHHLRRGLRRHTPLELLPASAETDLTQRPPDHALEDRRLAARLHAALDRITPKKRIAFLLFTLEGQSIDEVAALTGASRPATKSRIWFARRELIALSKNDPLLRDLFDASAKEER